MSFWEKVSYGEPGECWLWTGAKNHDGYGVFYVGAGKRELAHRAACRLAKPSMFDPSLHVLHTCDTPACCRPGHLFQGMQSDNNRDMWTKGRGRSLRGEAHYRAKLTEEQARAILVDTRTQNALAQAYGVSRWTVRRIKSRTNWRWL